MTELHPRIRTGLRRRVAAVTVALIALAGCSNTAKASLESGPITTAAPTTTTTTTVPETSTTEAPPPVELVGLEDLKGYIATPTGEPEVYAAPDRGAERIEVGATSPAGAPTTFAVIGSPDEGDPEWLQVLLPVRPNERTGFVPASTVEISRTDLRAIIDLDGRSMRVERDGVDVLTFDIAVGASHNPTPRSASYVTELLQTPNPGGGYGPYAFGLSIHSDQITEFGNGGDGQVGIHGTNQPQLIGSAVSAGCVRLRNPDIEALVAAQVPLGMPVYIS